MGARVTRGVVAARRGLLGLLGLLAVVELLRKLPHITGTTWPVVAAALRSVTPSQLLLLGLIWALSVWSYSWVLTAALPGLSRVRAIMLNLSGSAVGDVVPFGAAAGAGMNLTMIRSWRFPVTPSVTFLTVSNLWNVLSKLLLPVLVLVAVHLGGGVTTPVLDLAAKVAGALLVPIAAACLVAARRPAASPGRWVTDDVAAVIARGWRQLTLGMLGQLALQALLWWLCLRMLGVSLTPGAGFAGFAVERSLTMLPFTPSGAGIAEVGSISVLASLGADPAAATAAVLVFRAFVYLLEIPTGAASIAAWFWWRPRPVAT